MENKRSVKEVEGKMVAAQKELDAFRDLIAKPRAKLDEQESDVERLTRGWLPLLTNRTG